MTALLANNIEIGELNLASASKYIETGDLKALAVMKPNRMEEVPNVKTAKEQGINISFGAERGVVMPKGTPKDIVDHYASLFAAAAKDAVLAKSLKAKGTNITYMNADDYTSHLTTLYSDWEAIAKKVGVYKRDN